MEEQPSNDDAAELGPRRNSDDGAPPPLGALAKRLYDSGCRFMQAALAAHSDGDHDLFALHAAVAVEHLMKARLAAINPMLVLDFKGRAPEADVLLWLADETKHEEAAPAGLRTIGADRAFELLRLQFPLDRYSDALAKLRAQRNGLSHFGEADLTDLADDLPKVVGAVAELGEGLIGYYSGNELFGPHAGFAESQLGEWNDEEDREYFGRREQAQLRVLERYPDLPTNAALRATLARAIEERFVRTRSSLDEQLADCPVCGLPALLHGRLYLYLESDYDGAGTPLNAYPSGEYQATRLECPTCGLVLDADLIHRSGLLENWYVRHQDMVRLAVEDVAAANQHFPEHS